MNPSVLRLLDANANRAREALRVLEDYSRFVLNDQETSARLKTLRHTLAEVIGPLGAEAILHRDTPGDVGVANKTPAEGTREDLAHVITAAGKRLGEALRSIEEFLKTQSPSDAARVEGMRYAFYDVEQRLARTLRPADRFAAVLLYVLLTEKLCERPWLETAEQALLGGADCLQLREKEMESGELLRRARQLVSLCRKHGALCIINDRPDIAVLADADGVHVGQEDLPAVEVRKVVGTEKIVGVSTHRIEQARQAVLDGADYIGVGPFFRSATKPRDFIAGPGYARQVAEEINIPAVAIAGITPANVDEVQATGIKAVAVSSAVIAAADVRGAAEGMKRRLESASVGQTFLSAFSGGADILVCRESASGGIAAPGADAPPPSQAILEIKRRRLPHWRLEGSAYFVTFRVASGVLNTSERASVLGHIKAGDAQFYRLFAAVVMPDHAHVLLRPNEGVELSRILKGIKGVSARLVNTSRNSHGSVWQDESWDRIMRDQAEFDEKLEYMLNNPVKKGLVSDPWQYDGWYYNSSAR
ncbi:MAG: Thiamine-phosphate pyrophosphorylase [Phycisphaerales bacterium]|nr:Thiamine-phosphate pyrophosphorylase [Phycisphaerales bacterium]